MRGSEPDARSVPQLSAILLKLAARLGRWTARGEATCMMITTRLTSLARQARSWIEQLTRSSEACVGCGVVGRPGPRRIAGPGLTICRDCVQQASGALDGWHPGEVRTFDDGVAARGCAFCGKARANTLGLVAWPAGAICGECIGLCEDILQESAAHPKKLLSNDR
jgi:hypothetical protein